MSATPQLPSDADALSQELLADYLPQAGAFDELLDAERRVKPRWRPIIEAFARMSGGERAAVRGNAERMLHDNGVVFVAQGDADQTSRPWRLDVLPMVIAPEEWRLLEAGLIQRARLLNGILADLYSEQRVIQNGALPPGMIFGNPQFLRPCAHVPVRGDIHLHFLAFDVARGPAGAWWVLSDRAEAPSGAGFALENRVVLSHCLPELFTAQNVLRQASFFRAFNEHFMSLAGSETPSAVFLTRGPSKRTYFEHAYLARYLGYTIAEGSDLTVRDDRVFLKTVEGLKPVDLIMRTVRGEMSDPLELRTDSLIGVPGLLQAVRAGRVTIANALGSGLVESDAFMSFLPALCRHHLGEELALPSVATWWCGQPAEREHVLAHLDDLVVRRISTTRSVLFGRRDGRAAEEDKTGERRAALIREIEAHGHDFVGQERVRLATAPVIDADGKVKASPVVLRIYVAATREGYRVMPGALARISVGSDPHSTWLAPGDISKDTWVLSDAPVETFSLLAQRQDGMKLRRGTRDLPSRAADNLFWLGRYAERAEGAVRLLRSLVIRLRGETGSTRRAVSPERVVSLLVMQKHLSARRGKSAMEKGRAAVEQELWTILFDPECRDGLANVLDNVRRNADVVRDRLAFDAFRILKDLADAIQVRRSSRHATDDALRLLNRLILLLAGFNGLVMENMTRGFGWRFLDMGRRLERLRTIVEITRQLTVRGDPERDGELELLLELADSSMTYRGRYQATPSLAAVLDLLLCDDSNPRAALFQVLALADHLQNLPRSDNGGVLSADQRLTTRLATDLKLADTFALSEALGRFNARLELDRLLRRTERAGREMSDHISRKFFSHSAPRRISGSERSGER